MLRHASSAHGQPHRHGGDAEHSLSLAPHLLCASPLLSRALREQEGWDRAGTWPWNLCGRNVIDVKVISRVCRKALRPGTVMASTQTLQGGHFTSGSVPALSQPPEELCSLHSSPTSR